MGNRVRGAKRRCVSKGLLQSSSPLDEFRRDGALESRYDLTMPINVEWLRSVVDAVPDEQLLFPDVAGVESPVDRLKGRSLRASEADERDHDEAPGIIGQFTVVAEDGSDDGRCCVIH